MVKRSKVPLRLQRWELMALIIKRIDWHRPLSPESRKHMFLLTMVEEATEVRFLLGPGWTKITRADLGLSTLGYRGPAPVRYWGTGGKLRFFAEVSG